MEQFISVFDMFKISVGPSSSHTLGPWLAAQHCMQSVDQQLGLTHLQSVHVLLYGSLAKTGKGHGTDLAILMGLMGMDPVTINTENIVDVFEQVKSSDSISINQQFSIPFDYKKQVQFLKDQSLSYHPNGIQFLIEAANEIKTYTYYSVGGGFIEFENEQGLIVSERKEQKNEVPFNFFHTSDLIHWCIKTGLPISEIVRENEKSVSQDIDVEKGLDKIWQTMLHSIFKGAHSKGVLPGGLKVQRRAYDLNTKLLKEQVLPTKEASTWIQEIKKGGADFTRTLDWVSCFALAVNEENASFGRVVTAPTNGAAGVIPAVLLYAIVFCNQQEQAMIHRFLLTANAIGILFKNGATISAAMGGCQAEIGVSSAMAAAGLTELLGGNQKQVLMAAEIAMEHHLGLTCDPVGGLVQIPCIERNTMGAIKAITAAQLALQSKPDYALVSLEKVIETMWNTAMDMHVKYKETADGGLATQIPIGLAEC